MVVDLRDSVTAIVSVLSRESDRDAMRAEDASQAAETAVLNGRLTSCRMSFRAADHLLIKRAGFLRWSVQKLPAAR